MDPEKDGTEDRLDPSAAIAWAAMRHGDRVAVVDGGRRFSFQDIHRRSNRLANALLGHGFPPETRVGKLVGNCVEVLDIHFGALKAGGATVSLHGRNSVPEHLHMLNDSGTEILFVGAANREQVPGLREGCGSLRHIVGVGWEEEGVPSYEKWIEGASDRPPGVKAAWDAPAFIHYSSGTTGKPKGSVNTHRSHAGWLRNFYANLDFRMCDRDTMLHVAPLTHASFNYTETSLLRGVRNVILPRFDAERFLETVERERVTLSFLVPTMIRMLVDSPRAASADLSSLHTINYGASPIPEDLIDRAIGLFGPIFRQHYGMTEARQPNTILLPEEHAGNGSPEERRRLASCGKTALGVALTLLDEEDQPVREGEIGEIGLRGPHIIPGYWNNPEATAEAMRSGWLHTGDMARMDEDGYLYIVDRKKDMLISGGFNIFPREVEEVIRRHPAVQEVVVIGVPDEKWGESVKAIVVPRPGAAATEEEIIGFCRDRLASFKKPRHVEFVEDYPRNHIGKILRRVLRDEHWQGMKRRVN